MPRSIAGKQPNVGKRVKPPTQARVSEQKGVSDLVHPPKIAEVERAAAKVKHRAEQPADRSAELLLEESEVSAAGISSPQNAKQTIRAGR
jgi:hypothetical protein